MRTLALQQSQPQKQAFPLSSRSASAPGLQRGPGPPPALSSGLQLDFTRIPGTARPIQRKPTVSSPGDPFEREADEVAEKVMRTAEPSPVGPGPAAIQRKCAECEEEDEKKKRIQTKPAPAQAGTAMASLDTEAAVRAAERGGTPLSSEARAYFEPRFQQDFSRVRVHADGQAAEGARAAHARAFTLGRDIVFGSGEYSPATSEGRRLLAHELAHVVQQTGGGGASTWRQPAIGHPPTLQRQACNSPRDKMVVEAAKKRLAVLEPQLTALQGQKTAVDVEKLRVQDERKRFDDTSDDASIGVKRRNEELKLEKLNRKPIQITVTGDSITIRIKLQVLFNDPRASQQFSVLNKTIQAGIDLVWNQTLGKGVFANRKFAVIPEVKLINALGDRTDDAWLIEVRKTDSGKVTHPGCTLPQPGPGDPTSVTEPLCDNGVMSIPPAHVTNAGVIGHELLHLFGLEDRYVMFTDIPAKGQPGKPKVTLQPSRETRGRKDPLGGQDGTILSEDLNYLLDKLGIYDKEKDRSAPRLALVEREVMRLQEIVRTGCDPDSLLPIRKDFNDKVIKTAEDL